MQYSQVYRKYRRYSMVTLVLIVSSAFGEQPFSFFNQSQSINPAPGYNEPQLSLFDRFSPANAQESKSYILRVQFPPSIVKTPSLCAYYKGEQLEFEGNFCILPQDKECSQFTLFITKPEDTPRPKADGKNIHYLERQPKKPCRLFYITRKNTLDPREKAGWTVEEESAKRMPLRIPDDAIILLLDPGYIQEIKEDPDKTAAAHVIYLPPIKLKSTLSKEELQRTCDTSVLASLDLKTIHRKTPRSIKKEQSIQLCMRVPDNESDSFRY